MSWSIPKAGATAAVIIAVLTHAAPASAQLRVVSYNIAAFGGDLDDFAEVIAAVNTDDVGGFAVAPHVYVFQEVQSFNAAVLLDTLNAVAPRGVTYALATYTNTGEDDFSGAQALCFRSDTLRELTNMHTDIYTGAGRDADRWGLQLIGYDSLQATFLIYSAHLRAGDDPGDDQDRLEAVVSIRADADEFLSSTNFIFAGDFNLQSNLEPAYEHFFTRGTGRANDPLGVGSWSGSSNAIKHTQSPRSVNQGPLIGGGLDDRFDFQLVNDPLVDGAGLSLIDGSYRSVGNDGEHYNTAINSGDNEYFPGDIARSNALADALHEASDHIPVLADYQIPAMMAGTLTPDFGRVIQHATVDLAAVVSNAAAVVDPVGADVLAFDAFASGALSGFFSGVVEALDQLTFDIPLDTTEVGPADGAVLLVSDNQAVQNDVVVLNTTGRIVRQANPSFFDEVDADVSTIDWPLDANTGVQTIDVDVFNFGFDGDQALLDIDEVAGVFDRFGFVGGLAMNIGADPATLTFSFDTDDAAPGDHEAVIEIAASDEDIPGEGQSVLVLTLRVLVDGGDPIVGDLDGDGIVGSGDLLLLLGAWGDCAECDDCTPDLDGDCLVGGADLLILLGNWG